MKNALESEYEIFSIKRLKRLTTSKEWQDSETIRVGFKSSTLPSYVYGYGCLFKVEPYTFPVTQYSGCWKYGHIARFCPTKKILYPKCGQSHANCDTKTFKCINCNQQHMSLDKNCPVFVKEKEIRDIMYKENITYRMALKYFLSNRNEKEVTTYTEKAKASVKLPMNSEKKKVSYRDMLVSKAGDQQEMDNSEGNYTDEEDSIQSDSNTSRNKRKDKRITKKNKKYIDINQLLAEDMDSTTYEKEEQITRVKKRKIKNTDRTLSFESFIQEFTSIILSDCSVAEKITQFLKYLIEILKYYLTTNIKNGDLISKILSLINDG